jgi:hypothetical protein
MGDAGYTIRWQGRPVARVGSVAGLLTALGRRDDRNNAERDIVSFAYVLEGAEWFADWVRASDPRTIDVYDERSRRRVRLEVASIADSSRDGVIYEAQVSSANGFFDAVAQPRTRGR